MAKIDANWLLTRLHVSNSRNSRKSTQMLTVGSDVESFVRLPWLIEYEANEKLTELEYELMLKGK